MDVTLYYDDGTDTTFVAEDVDVHGDVAYVDGILQTSVDSVEVSA